MPYLSICEFAAATVLVWGALIVWLLYRISHPRLSAVDLNAWIEVQRESWQPLERLLDPGEFEFLRRLGVDPKRIRRLRARRRELFRMYIRRVVTDFNSVCHGIQEVMVCSRSDRPDLIRTVARQHALFYRTVVLIELRLALDAMDFDAGPSVQLVRKLESVHMHCLTLVQASEEGA